jgi:hypothetical protein
MALHWMRSIGRLFGEECRLSESIFHPGTGPGNFQPTLGVHHAAGITWTGRFKPGADAGRRQHSISRLWQTAARHGL